MERSSGRMRSRSRARPAPAAAAESDSEAEAPAAVSLSGPAVPAGALNVRTLFTGDRHPGVRALLEEAAAAGW